MSQYSLNNGQNYSDKPILFMILDRGGNILLRHAFSDDFNKNEHLIASFLMAMNIFASEAFTYSSQLEEIKFNNYTVIVHSSEDAHYTFIFQGKSSKASCLLGRLINLIEKEMILDLSTEKLVRKEIVLSEKLELQIKSFVQ